MNLIFHIDYHTVWGESLYLFIENALAGSGDPQKGLKMNPEDDRNWTLGIDVENRPTHFSYSYAVINENGEITRKEWGHKRSIDIATESKNIVCYDQWQDLPVDKPVYSSAIVKCLNHRDKSNVKNISRPGFTTITVSAPMVGPDEVVAVSGACEALGNWNPRRSIVMNDAEFPTWSVNIENGLIPFGCEFKFIILKKNTGEVVAWEKGENRRFNYNAPHRNDTIIISGLRFNSPLTPWRGAGVAIPVFSLRSEKDFGVGDFYDLIKMVDWAVATGQNFIQILPINDTTMTYKWTDSYPYNANSTFALHPIYLRVDELGIIKDTERRKYFEDLRNELNALPQLDYERANNAKNEYTREIFKQEGKNTIESDAFIKFMEANREWLIPYAAFCVLRDMNGTADFSKWGAYACYSKDSIDSFVENNQEKINFVYYQQFHLDKQMKTVKDYARSHGVAIKGDIPIGISRTSVDAWKSPHLFNMNSQAGAPPDDFSAIGQNWGFPTYNWEEMSRDGFAWWKARFKKMSEYFDAYRIDHVLGFFRIWQIPLDCIHGVLGTFNPALPFTAEELKDSYGFLFSNELTSASISDCFLEDLFGNHTEEVKRRFIVRRQDGKYVLKSEFDNQRKIVRYFSQIEKSEKNDNICNALLNLTDNVLFIEDQIEKGKYHPRIAAQKTYAYRMLTDCEKSNFDRLYNDFFYTRNDDLWKEKAMWKLPPLIDETEMLTCAEDLGMIPACVSSVMNDLAILSLEIQRMPKDQGCEFGNTWTYPYLSVCTTSTHDMGGIRQWWEENREKTQRFYNSILHVDGTAPYCAEPWICEKIIDLNLKSPSMLCILPLQDWLSISSDIRRENPYEEQINNPSNPRHYWCYRMHLTIEKLLSETLYNNRILEMIKNSGR